MDESWTETPSPQNLARWIDLIRSCVTDPLEQGIKLRFARDILDDVIFFIDRAQSMAFILLSTREDDRSILAAVSMIQRIRAELAVGLQGAPGVKAAVNAIRGRLSASAVIVGDAEEFIVALKDLAMPLPNVGRAGEKPPTADPEEFNLPPTSRMLLTYLKQNMQAGVGDVLKHLFNSRRDDRQSRNALSQHISSLNQISTMYEAHLRGEIVTLELLSKC